MSQDDMEKENDILAANQLLKLIRNSIDANPADTFATKASQDEPPKKLVLNHSEAGKLAQLKNKIIFEEQKETASDPISDLPDEIQIKEVPPLYLGEQKKAKLFSRNAVGLDIGNHSIKCVELEKNSQGIKLASCSIVQIAAANPKVSNYNQARLISTQQAVQKINLKQVKIISAVGGTNIDVRQLQFPAMTEKELESAIKWEAKKHIPANIQDAKSCFQILKRENGKMDVLLVTTPNSVLHNYKLLMQQVRIDPYITDVAPLALVNALLSSEKVPENEALILLDIGSAVTTLNIYSEIGEYFVHYVPVTGDSFTKEIQLKFQVGHHAAEAIKKTDKSLIKALKTSLDKMVYDVRKTLNFYKNQVPVKNFSKLFITGASANIPELGSFLSENLTVPVEIFNPFKNIIIDNDIFPPESIGSIYSQFALSIGLALRGVKS